MTQYSPQDILTNEFSRIINVHHVGVGSPATCAHNANEEELKALSERFEYCEVLSAQFTCTVTARGSYAVDHDVKGTYKAILVDQDEQGEAQENIIEGDFDIRIASFDQEEMYDHEDYDDLDIEFTQDGAVDIGEIISQYIIIEYCSLNYDFSQEDEGDEDDTDADNTDNAKRNPFADLATLLNPK